jgi:hypothetical protein
LDEHLIVSHSRNATEATRCIEVETASRGLAKLRCVGSVKELSPELKMNRLGEVEIFED